jgi:hypothetical protein
MNERRPTSFPFKRWFEEQVAKAAKAGTMVAAEYWLTPEGAQFLVEHRNLNNRPLTEMHVAALAKSMADGNFALTGQGVSIDESGNILDGQHRITAVARGTVTVRLLFIFGCKRNTFVDYDTVLRQRSGSDTLRTDDANIKSAAALASAAQFLYAIETNTLTRSAKIPNRIIIEFIKNHPFLPASVEYGTTLYKGVGRKVSRKAASVAFHQILSLSKHTPWIDSFISQVSTPDNLPKGSPILLLRDKLIGQYFPKTSMTPAERVIREFQAIILTWNGYIRAEMVHSKQEISQYFNHPNRIFDPEDVV